ncbi:MAG: glycosyltransferase family 2 protein [Elusimicrobiota bacterium]
MGFKNPSVSIMIPCYNFKDRILKAVNSALNQDYSDLEVIVLDDMSTDGSWDIIKSFYEGLREEEKKRIKIFRNENNLGRTKTYKKLLYGLSKGDWVLMLDGDDYLYDNSVIETAICKFKENYADDIIAILGGFVKYDSSVNKYFENIPHTKLINGFEVVMKYPNVFYSHGAVLYDRKKALELDFYRAGIISDDLESHLRFFLRGKVLYIDKVFYVWNVTDFSATIKTTYSDFLDNVKKLTESVYSDGVSLWPERKKIFDLWKKRSFLRLANMLVSIYALKDNVSAKKIFSDVVARVGAVSLIFSSFFITLILYSILPKFLFLKIRNKAMLLRKKYFFEI